MRLIQHLRWRRFLLSHYRLLLLAHWQRHRRKYRHRHEFVYSPPGIGGWGIATCKSCGAWDLYC